MIGKPKNFTLLLALVCLVSLGTQGLENSLVFGTLDDASDGLPGPGKPRHLSTCANFSSPPSLGYGYGRRNGPRTWPDTFPTCDGSRQSPINIDLDRADDASSEERRRLRFNNYDELPSQMFLTNVGSTVTLTINITDSERPSISGFLLDDEYLFAEAHFHWGRNSREGSEHLVDGQSYPLEMHVVHFKKEYGSVSEAKKQRDGLAVLGYFFEVTRDRNRRLQRLINSFDEIPKPGCAPASIRPFRLEELAPPFRRKFVSYSGSLTTPLCEQVVRWIVNLRPLRISFPQLPPFRRLKDGSGNFLVRNFRPPQRSNRRRVIYVE